MGNDGSWISEEFLKEQVIAVTKFRAELREVLLFEGQEAYEKRLKELTEKPTTMTNRGNEPAHPFVTYNENGYGEAVCIYSPDGSKQIIPYKSGMTIREKIAADNLAALYSAMTLLPIDRQKGVCRIWQEKYGETTLGRAMALDSIELADCLIAELSKPQEK